MKKFKLNIFVLMIFLLIALSSCVNHDKEILKCYQNISEYGDVIYAERTDTFLQIIGLSEKGKQTTHLVIPSWINNKYVMGVGITADQEFDDIFRLDYFPRKGKDSFVNNNVEVIYNGAHHIHNGVIDEIVKSGNVKKIVNYCFECGPSAADCFPYTIYDKYCDTIVVSPEYYENYECKENVVPANVIFYTDFYIKDLYWIDYYEEDSLIFEPPAPTIDGYIFKGWRTEDCEYHVGLWNFKDDMFIYDNENNTPLVLYAVYEHK